LKILKYNLIFWISQSYLEIKIKYRRSVIGPWWITLSTGIIILGLSLVFSGLFNMSASEIIPWIAVSLVIWNYIQMVINDATTLFEVAPLGTFKLNPLDIVSINVFKNIMMFCHNFVIIIFIIIFFKIPVQLISFTFLYGILIILITSISVEIIIATLCLRFRDFVQIVQSLLFLTFIMTPIFWKPEILEGRRSFLVDYNILYHYIETIRSPILYQVINFKSVLIASIATILLVVVAYITFNRTIHKLVYWK
jgi:ABC-type polysaccharide/polyol phosphate export permease